MTTWRKSSFSAEDSNCVEVAYSAEVAAIRDSKNPDGPRLMLTSKAYRALVAEYR